MGKANCFTIMAFWIGASWCVWWPILFTLRWRYTSLVPIGLWRVALVRTITSACIQLANLWWESHVQGGLQTTYHFHSIKRRKIKKNGIDVFLSNFSLGCLQWCWKLEHVESNKTKFFYLFHETQLMCVTKGDYAIYLNVSLY